ncbi:MAG: hypothetical protein ACP5GZ_10265 [Vulcanisaeta sp.]
MKSRPRRHPIARSHNYPQPQRSRWAFWSPHLIDRLDKSVKWLVDGYVLINNPQLSHYLIEYLAVDA